LRQAPNSRKKPPRQISKTFLAVCTLAVCTVSFCFASPDSRSQAQAREALRQKIAQLNAQDSTTATRTPKAASSKKKAVPAPKPQPAAQTPSTKITATAPPPTAATSAPVEKSAPNAAPITYSTQEEIARQREAVRQKITDLSAQEKAVKSATPRKAACVEKQPRAKPHDTQSNDVIKPEQAAAAAEAKARAEEQQRGTVEAKTPKMKARKSKPEMATEIIPTQFGPIESPPPVVPASKAAKLEDLLQKYKADQITPEEYHNQRAKILAEP